MDRKWVFGMLSGLRVKLKKVSTLNPKMSDDDIIVIEVGWLRRKVRCQHNNILHARVL